MAANVFYAQLEAYIRGQSQKMYLSDDTNKPLLTGGADQSIFPGPGSQTNGQTDRRKGQKHICPAYRVEA